MCYIHNEKQRVTNSNTYGGSLKILIVCAVGMSSSLIVNKMKKMVPEGTIVDCSTGSNISQEIDGYDVLLVGPQLRYKKDEFDKVTKEAGVPYGFINMMQYGRAMVEEIYAQAVALYKSKDEKNE